MDEDTEQAAWAQQEQDERRRREDEIINRVRKQTAGFRAECDQFTAEFKLKTIQRNEANEILRESINGF